MNKLIILFLALFSFSVLADKVVTHNEYYNQDTIDEATKGFALSNALAGIDCNMSSDKYHGGVSAGFYGSNLAGAGGVCKRFGDTLIKFSLGTEDGESGGNIAAMFNFN